MGGGPIGLVAEQKECPCILLADGLPSTEKQSCYGCYQSLLITLQSNEYLLVTARH